MDIGSSSKILSPSEFILGQGLGTINGIYASEPALYTCAFDGIPFPQQLSLDSQISAIHGNYGLEPLRDDAPYAVDVSLSQSVTWPPQLDGFHDVYAVEPSCTGAFGGITPFSPSGQLQYNFSNAAGFVEEPPYAIASPQQSLSSQLNIINGNYGIEPLHTGASADIASLPQSTPWPQINDFRGFCAFGSSCSGAHGDIPSFSTPDQYNFLDVANFADEPAYAIVSPLQIPPVADVNFIHDNSNVAAEQSWDNLQPAESPSQAVADPVPVNGDIEVPRNEEIVAPQNFNCGNKCSGNLRYVAYTVAWAYRSKKNLTIAPE